MFSFGQPNWLIHLTFSLLRHDYTAEQYTLNHCSLWNELQSYVSTWYWARKLEFCISSQCPSSSYAHRWQSQLPAEVTVASKYCEPCPLFWPPPADKPTSTNMQQQAHHRAGCNNSNNNDGGGVSAATAAHVDQFGPLRRQAERLIAPLKAVLLKVQQGSQFIRRKCCLFVWFVCLLQQGGRCAIGDAVATNKTSKTNECHQH